MNDDLAAIEARAYGHARVGYDERLADTLALIGEVRRLRAKLDRVEALLGRVESLADRWDASKQVMRHELRRALDGGAK